MGESRNQKGNHKISSGKGKVEIQNIWDEVEAVLRKGFIAVNAYTDKKGKISNNQPNFIPQ